MKFVEYTGEVIPDKKQDKTFEKDEGGFKVGSVEQLSKDLGNDWWHLPATFIAGAGLAKAGQAAYDWYKSKQTAPELQPRVDPTFSQTPANVVDAPVKPAVNPIEALDTRLAQAKAANAPVAPATPIAANAPAMPPMASPAGAGLPSGGVVPMPAPTVAEAVATGANPTKTVQTEVAKLVDSAPAQESGVKTRVRQSAKQIAEAAANAPEGMIPAYPVKNKRAGDVIGQGGWHWYQGQMGPEAEQAWLRQFGRTNQPYQDVVTATKSGLLPVPAPVEGKKGGTFPREKYVPEYIKGSSTIPAMLSVAGNALGIAAIADEVKKAKKTGDWSNVGLDVIGQILGNVAPKASLPFSLMAPGTLNANEEQELAKYRAKKPTITGAIAPR